MRVVTRIALAAGAILLPGCYRYPPSTLSECRLFATEVPGPEDVELEPDDGNGRPRLLISGTERRFCGPVDENGIFAVEIGSDGFPGRTFSLPAEEGDGTACRIASPHGLSMTSPYASDGKRRLFVINHESCASDSCSLLYDCSEESIERYRIEPTRLVFERRYTGPALLRPNDLVVSADGRDLYVTNTTGAHNCLTKLWELFARSEWSAFVRYRDDAPGAVLPANVDVPWEWVDSLAYGNGVAISEDGQSVFVAELRKDAVIRFQRSPDGALTRKETVCVAQAGAPDNFTWGAGGQLYVATHPHLSRIVAHWFGSFIRSPSRIARIDTHATPTSSSLAAITEIGSTGDAVSVALPTGRRFFLGQVLDDGLVTCRCSDPDCREVSVP